MYFIIILFWVWTASFYTDLSWLGVSTSEPWWHALTYSFVHTNFLHLLFNSILFMYYWQYLRQFKAAAMIGILVFCAVFSGLMAKYDTPTIGASAVVLAEIGIVLAVFQRKPLVKSCCLLAIIFAIQGLLAPQINTMIHIYSVVTAYAIARPLRNYIFRRS